jgi:hypothetical protein
MPGALYQYLSDDHDRLDNLLRRALETPGVIDEEAYAGFRKGLLRHIGLEEKIVLPAIAKLQAGAKAPMADRIRLDHGAIVALLVPPPSPSIVATLQSILLVHNALEEEEIGLYQLFEGLVGSDAEAFLEKLKTAPDVPVLPHNQRPDIIDATRRAVARAGYKFQDPAE